MPEAPTLTPPADQPEAPTPGDVPATPAAPAESPPESAAIAKERDDARRELSAAKRELDRLQKAAKEAEDAEKTELQKLQESLAEKERLAAEKDQQLRDTHMRADAQTAALELGFLRPERAWREVDVDGIEFDDAGRAQNLRKLLEDELKARPELKAQGPRQPDSGAGERGGTLLTIDQIRKLTPEEYEQRRDEVHEALARHRAGR